MMKIRALPILRSLLLLTATACTLARAMDIAIVDLPESDNDRRREYSRIVLHMVLERTTAEFGPYRIDEAPRPMERRRLLSAMKEGNIINILAIQADAQWQEALLPVPIPIDLGLQSWRLLLTDARTLPRLRQLAINGRLTQAIAGVGETWVLRRIMEENRYGLVAGNSYEGLFLMLQAKRFDYMPRTITEIFNEFDNHRAKYPSLVVEDSIVLNAPVPLIFFVSPKAERLHRRVTAGLEAMLQDGSLAELVLRYFRQDLERARLCNRIRIDLVNSTLDPAMLARRELWIDPFEPRYGICPRRLHRSAR